MTLNNACTLRQEQACVCFHRSIITRFLRVLDNYWCSFRFIYLERVGCVMQKSWSPVHPCIFVFSQPPSSCGSQPTCYGGLWEAVVCKEVLQKLWSLIFRVFLWEYRSTIWIWPSPFVTDWTLLCPLFYKRQMGRCLGVRGVLTTLQLRCGRHCYQLFSHLCFLASKRHPCSEA